MTNSALNMFMELKGIDPDFVDAWGKPAKVSDNNIRNIIHKMGYDANNDNTLTAHYLEQENQHWLSLLPPVAIYQKDDTYILDVCLPIDFATDDCSIKLLLKIKMKLRKPYPQ